MRGSVTCSCGHKLADDEDSISVAYETEVCDAVDGFSPAVAYAEFCPKCEQKWREKGWLFDSPEAAHKWLREQSDAYRYPFVTGG